MIKRKAALHNLGCKVNAYETEAMQQMLEKAGYEIVPFRPGADVYIINTCTVTNIADRKSRQMLHKAKKMNPEAIVVAVGCYVQAAKEDLEVDPAIDVVIGNNRKKDLVEILAMYGKAEHTGAAAEEAVIDINQVNEYESLSIEQTAEHTRAYIKVQDGCNQFCTYCIIPYTRGRVRSRLMEDVVKEIGSLAAKGYQEVVLTGIHLSSYGKDIETDLLKLICAVNEIEGIRRIRLGSLEPRIITEEFAETLSAMPKLCPHFHLSLQSGCTETLKRMNRRYTAEEFAATCDLLRRKFDNPAITTDVIVGFPGEDDEEFAQTRGFLERVHLYETHVFKYSRRKGTQAAKMPNQVPDQVKTERSNILLQLNAVNQESFEVQHLDKTAEVLFEEEYRYEGKRFFVGHTKEYIKVAMPVDTDEDYTNQIVTVRLEDGRINKILLCKRQ